MAWTPIGNPGNACDPQATRRFPGCFGSVSYTYSIGTYEVTNAQYAEFLNAKAATDPFRLYETNMGDPASRGGIRRGGSPGSYTYHAIAGREDMPVNSVSFYDALRFANWMNNGQGNGDTETGAYTITTEGVNDNSITRNTDATFFLPSEDEWYKAAYYDPASGSYFDYPAGSNTQTTCWAPTPTPNNANCGMAEGDFTIVGSYTASRSPYGTFDEGGNVWEWNETIFGPNRGVLGGGAFHRPDHLAAFERSFANGNEPTSHSDGVGFRLAMITKPHQRHHHHRRSVRSDLAGDGEAAP
jgi:formylglycine-generating enzyme required for sulfatase activity